MSCRPLNCMTADELSDVVRIAKQEYDVLTKKFGTTLGLQHEVISYLAISVGVQATLKNREGREYYARPWYKRLLP